MGKAFGELYKLQGIVIFSLSPFEQRAYAGAFKHGVPNMLRRIRESIFYVMPPLLIAGFLYIQIKAVHKRYGRKNPKDYENDE